LALSILVAALAILAELTGIGTRSARSARDLSVAQLLCESKLAEYTAGIAPLGSVQDTPISIDPYEFGYGWSYSVVTAPLDDMGLTSVEVTVTENNVALHPLSFTLVRWMRDPVALSDAAALAESAAEATSASSTESSSSG